MATPLLKWKGAGLGEYWPCCPGLGDVCACACMSTHTHMQREKDPSPMSRDGSSKRASHEFSVIVGNSSRNDLENFNYGRALFSAPVIFWTPGGWGRWVTLQPGLFLKSLCLSAQVLSWWRNNHRYIRFTFLPLTPARSAVLGLNVGLCSPGPPSSALHRGLKENGPQECTPNRAKLFKLREEERKNGEGAGRRRKAFLVGSISLEIFGG